MEFIADQQCFVCGQQNPIGMKLSFHQNDDAYCTTVTFPLAYQGYAGIVHGGIVATVLDEVMARYVWEKVGPAATAKLEVNYRAPVPTGVAITFRAVITAERRTGRVFETAATARLADGTLLAEARGMVMRLKNIPEAIVGNEHQTIE